MGASRLLLASKSPRRRELMALLGLPFEVTSADVMEAPHPGEGPAALVVRLSQAKARAVDGAGWGRAGGIAGGIIIACDTVVAFEGDILGKPQDAVQACAMLQRLRGRSHTVCSAVTLLAPATGYLVTDAVRTEVSMRRYGNDEVAAYVASGDPLDKAGAYAIQHAGFHPVARLQGCYASVMGFPLCHLTRCLRAWQTGPTVDVPVACQVLTGHTCGVYGAILAGQPGGSSL